MQYSANFTIVGLPLSKRELKTKEGVTFGFAFEVATLGDRFDVNCSREVYQDVNVDGETNVTINGRLKRKRYDAGLDAVTVTAMKK